MSNWTFVFVIHLLIVLHGFLLLLFFLLLFRSCLNLKYMNKWRLTPDQFITCYQKAEKMEEEEEEAKWKNYNKTEKRPVHMNKICCFWWSTWFLSIIQTYETESFVFDNLVKLFNLNKAVGFFFAIVKYIIKCIVHPNIKTKIEYLLVNKSSLTE